jgi:hypothetical protein
LEQLEILDPVISLHAVLVMNHFAGSQIPPKVLLHHQAVLWHIAVVCLIWVAGLANMNVAVNGHMPSAFPVRASIPSVAKRKFLRYSARPYKVPNMPLIRSNRSGDFCKRAVVLYHLKNQLGIPIHGAIALLLAFQHAIQYGADITISQA